MLLILKMIYNKNIILALLLFLSFKLYPQNSFDNKTMYKHGMSPQITINQIFKGYDFKFKKNTNIISIIENDLNLLEPNKVNNKNIFIEKFSLDNNKPIMYQESFNIGYHIKIEMLNGVFRLYYVYYIKNIGLQILINPINYRFKIQNFID